MNRDAIGGTITLITAVVTLVLVVAFFYACRSGGTDHLREEEYEDVGSAAPTERPASASTATVGTNPRSAVRLHSA